MPDWIPAGWHSVTPRLVADDPAKLVAFIARVFGASGAYHADSPSQMKIGDSIVMVSGAGPRKALTSFLYVYIDDVDATYHLAIGAGATPVEEPRDTPYGDRRAMITDPFGNDWQIATYRGSGPARDAGG
jgi:uncharacterized glyoxalase superfamily protein PhnB